MSASVRVCVRECVRVCVCVKEVNPSHNMKNEDLKVSVYELCSHLQ